MIVAEKAVDFKSMEREIFKKMCEWGCELLKQILERYDAHLMLERDRTVYRHKGQRKTAIKTVMGTVEYSRSVYQQRNEDGTKRCVFLLDEVLGKEGSGLMSGNLAEMVTFAACESSYRSAALAVSEMTGQHISHQAAWGVVQELGERVGTQEKQSAQLAAANKGVGKLERPVLFEEQDGIHLPLQGKSRKQHGPKREMKVGIAYDGAKKTGKNRYELTNKVACANFETAGKFQKRKEGAIAAVYNVDEIETRLLNGDGAEWIKGAIADENTHFQLDPYHRNKAVLQYVSDSDARNIILKLLYSKQIDLLLDVIEAYSNSTEDEKQRNDFLALLTYFQNNRNGLTPCHRQGLDLPNPPEGIEYRRMGCMESNIFTIIGNRMKGRRALWSIDGGNNLARLLCLKATKKLSDTLQNLTAVSLPEKYAEEIQILSASKVAKSAGKGYDSYHKSTAPATPEYGWLRDLGSLKSSLEF
jgi:hypothetical protein